MKKMSKKNIIFLIVFVLVVDIVIQSAALGAIAKVKRENKVQDAYIYANNVIDVINYIGDNDAEAAETLKYFYLTYGEDCFKDFDVFAKSIYEDNPTIGSLYIAPDAIIQVAYPDEVKETTIGFDMLNDPEQGPRAQMAVDTGLVTVAGPLKLIEGGVGFIIRNPIFDTDGSFIGFTIVVIDWDKMVEQVLNSDSVVSDKYRFAVWKETNDEICETDEYGYIFRSSEEKIKDGIDIEFQVPNDTWHLLVEPVDGWLVYKEMGWEIFMSLLLSTSIILVVFFGYKYDEHRRLLEKELTENEEREAYTRKLTEALKAAEVANESKTAFLNNMSHDIRTPMNAILGFAGLMKNELDDPDKLSDHLDKIRSSGEYLLGLINNVLDMARIDSGKETLNESFFDIRRGVKNTYSVFEADIKKKGLTLKSHIDIEHNYVMCDYLKINQIWLNLFSNAIKYTPEGGTIEIEILEIGFDGESATYEYSLKDNGIGISKEYLPHIFDNFSRESNTTKSKISGTGLGMPIVRSLVELMGGTIEVQSEQGKGTKVTIRSIHKIVKYPELYMKDNEKAITTDGITFTGRVLIAEDNDMNAEITMTLLTELGLTVDRAVDGIDCIDKLIVSKDDPYELILMDVQMPRMDGYEAAEKIRKLEDTHLSDIPIFAVTANAFKEDKKKALKSGMDGHLVKPIDINVLRSTLAMILKVNK